MKSEIDRNISGNIDTNININTISDTHQQVSVSMPINDDDTYYDDDNDDDVDIVVNIGIPISTSIAT